MAQTRDYRICGWRVQSELPLPGLPELARGEGSVPDIRFRFGEAPETLAQAVMATPFCAIDPDGRCLLTIAGVARYYVDRPDEVVISAAEGADPAEIRLFLLGSVMGFLLHRHGLFPLHASCVVIGGRAFAFAGHSGAGKSTTAAGLAQRGHPLLGDDICVIDASAKPPLAVPGLARLKLWSDSLAAGGIAPDGLERLGASRDKYALQPPAVAENAAPLAAIVLLHTAQEGEAATLGAPLGKLKAIATIGQQVFRPQMAQALGRQAALLAAQARLAEAVPVLPLARPAALEGYSAWLEEVEAALEEGGGAR